MSRLGQKTLWRTSLWLSSSISCFCEKVGRIIDLPLWSKKDFRWPHLTKTPFEKDSTSGKRIQIPFCTQSGFNTCEIHIMYLGQLLMKHFFALSGADSFRGMYVLRSLKLNRMYQLTSIDSDTFKASGENVQLKSLELSNNEKLQPLPWGIFRYVESIKPFMQPLGLKLYPLTFQCQYSINRSHFYKQYCLVKSISKSSPCEVSAKVTDLRDSFLL